MFSFLKRSRAVHGLCPGQRTGSETFFKNLARIESGVAGQEVFETPRVGTEGGRVRKVFKSHGSSRVNLPRSDH